jgi:hypothetical protein
MYKYKLLNRKSTHSFDNYQISVIDIIDKQKVEHKGFGVCLAPSLANLDSAPTEYDNVQVLIVDEQQVRLLCEFFEKVFGGELPNQIEVTTNGPTLTICFETFTEKWHGGGGLEGKIGFDTMISSAFFDESYRREKLISKYEKQSA